MAQESRTSECIFPVAAAAVRAAEMRTPRASSAAVTVDIDEEQRRHAAEGLGEFQARLR
jgi:hypothetical protein